MHDSYTSLGGLMAMFNMQLIQDIPRLQPVFDGTNHEVVEAVTHQPLHRVIQDEILDPLGLSETSYPTTPAMPSPFTRGYLSQSDGTLRDVTTSNPAPYTRKVAVYVPNGYVAGTEAPFIVGADGPDRSLFTALDNLIAEHRVPAMVAISIGNVVVSEYGGLSEAIRDKNIIVGVLAVPAAAAQDVADDLVDAGVKIIFNYSEGLLDVPADVQVHTSNPAVELLHALYFHLA